MKRCLSKSSNLHAKEIIKILTLSHGRRVLMNVLWNIIGLQSAITHQDIILYARPM